MSEESKDPRDLNGDGKVTLGEKIQYAAGKAGQLPRLPQQDLHQAPFIRRVGLHGDEFRAAAVALGQGRGKFPRLPPQGAEIDKLRWSPATEMDKFRWSPGTITGESKVRSGTQANRNRKTLETETNRHLSSP